MAIVNNPGFYKGERIDIVFTMTPVVDISNWTIVMTIMNNFGDAVALLTVVPVLTTPLAGVFTCSLTHAQTLALGAGSFAYDVQRTDAGSEAVLSIGDITITQEALYP